MSVSRRLLLNGSLAMVVASAGFTAPAVAAARHTTSALSSGGDLTAAEPACTPSPMKGVHYLAPDGVTKATQAVPGYAKVTEYTAADGNTVGEITPPSGFDPSTASDATLLAFGVPSRPAAADTAGRAAWANKIGKVRTWVESGAPCNSQSWASWQAWGGADSTVTTGDFRRADMNFVIPTFQASCPAASDAVVWTGIGGKSSAKLLQSGISTQQSTLNGVRMFYEWVGPNNTGVSEQYVGPVLPAGENLYTSTYYNINLNNAYFYWTNLDTNTAYSTMYFSGASTFYDGYSAEWIHEKPQSGQNYLRHWNPDYVWNPTAARAGQPSYSWSAFSHSGGSMTNGSHTTANVDSGGFGSSSWTYNWLACS